MKASIKGVIYQLLSGISVFVLSAPINYLAVALSDRIDVLQYSVVLVTVSEALFSVISEIILAVLMFKKNGFRERTEAARSCLIFIFAVYILSAISKVRYISALISNINWVMMLVMMVRSTAELSSFHVLFSLVVGVVIPLFCIISVAGIRKYESSESN